MSKLNAALELARQGFHVFPLEENSKIPLITKWQEKATRDEARIKRWWTCPVMGLERDYNIGICTTFYGDDKALIVIDVDNKDGKNGSAELKRYEVTATAVSETPTGGYHYFYVADKPVSNGVNVLGDGLDIRSKGGYVAAPGSEINGKYYRWKE